MKAHAAPPSELSQQISHLLQHTERLESAYHNLREELHLTHRALESAHTTLQQILSQLSDGLLFIDPEGKLIHYNEAAGHITDIPPSQAAGNLFWHYFADDLFGFSLHAALKGAPIPRQLLLSLSNGKEIAVVSAWVPPDKGLLLLLQDRTTLVQLEKSVQQQERCKELGEMAATLAHEIRNPLGGIEGFASLLKRDIEDPTQRNRIDAILEGSRVLNALVTHVLEYARPLTLHFMPTPMTPFLEEVVAFAHAAGYPCTLSMETAVTLSLDAPRMKLALLNLLKNASEAGATDTQLILTLEGILYIKDNGCGMDQAAQQKLFTPFFTTKTRGTGLGLPEVMKVVKAHGGSLTVTSHPGKGTTIALSFFGTPEG